MLALAAAAALPWYAFYAGHPFRVRYSVPLIVASAAIAGVAVSLLPRWSRLAAAAAIVAATAVQASPLDRGAPLIAESQRDAANQAGRRAVTAYLVAHHDGTPIMMSMGSLAHYMHDLAANGFAIRDFLHEGNGEVWKAAMKTGPRPYVAWVAIEEAAEGGDDALRENEGRCEVSRGVRPRRGRWRRSPVSGYAPLTGQKRKCIVKFSDWPPRSMRPPSSSLSS